MSQRYPSLEALFTGIGFHRSALIPWCQREFGSRDALAKISSDPWVLLLRDAPSCGFKRVSRLADRLRQPKDSVQRLAWWCWWQCHLVRQDTWSRIARLEDLAERDETVRFDPNKLRAALSYGKENGFLVIVYWNGSGYVASTKRSNEEASLAENCLRIDSKGEGRGWEISFMLEAHETMSKPPEASPSKRETSTPSAT